MMMIHGVHSGLKTGRLHREINVSEQSTRRSWIKNTRLVRGFANKNIHKSEIAMEVVGWSRSHSDFFLNLPDLSVLSISMMTFQKKFGWGVGWWGDLSNFFLGFFEVFFNFAKPLRSAILYGTDIWERTKRNSRSWK